MESEAFAEIMVKIELGKNHQELLNLGGNFDKEHVFMA